MSEENTYAEAKPEEVTTTNTTTPSPSSLASSADIASNYRPQNENGAGDEDSETADGDMIKEWVKFGVLVAVLFGAVFIVWATRPLIFGQIVPAVMNANPPAVVVQSEQEEQVDEAIEPAAEEDATIEMGIDVIDPETNTQQLPLVIQEESSVTVEEATENTAVEPPQETDGDARTIPYMVQQGDSLYAISQRYGVSIADIVTANGGVITNPNNIQPGTEIQIPVP